MEQLTTSLSDLMAELNPVGIVSEQIETLLRGTIELVPNLIAAFVILLLTALVAFGAVRLLRVVLRKSHARKSLIDAFATLMRIGVWTVGLLIAATVIFPNLTPTNLLAGLGLGSVAVGLAFKDIFENFFAGFLILMRKPMQIGDDIECEDLKGRVERITIRDTYLRQRSGELILVPNSYIYKNPTTVVTDRKLRRIDVVVGVAYDEDVDQSRDVIRDAVEGLETVSTEKPVQVFATTFNSSSVDFSVRWWTESSPLEEHKSRDKVVASIKRALDEAGIEIPFPYRTLTFKEPLEMTRQDDQRMAAE